MTTAFSEVLSKIRKLAGFSTAYRFYHDNGGRSILGFSYRKYLLFEQGKTLPEPDILNRLSFALKLIPKSPQQGVLAAAWLKTMAGDDNYLSIFEPFISIKQESPGLSPMHKAMSKFLKKTPITVNQSLKILSSREHYLSFMLLANDKESWSPERLSKVAGFDEKRAGEILADFGKAGLVKKEKRGSYQYSIKNIIMEFPRAEIMPPGLYDKMRDYQTKMISKGGTTWRRLTMLRADAVELAAFYPVLSIGMSSATAYAVDEKTKNSSMFAIESKVIKLFDF